jgi:hypothetical protein
LVEEVDGAEAELLAVVAWRGEAPNGGERRRPVLGFRVRRAQKERGESAGGGERMRMRGERARGPPGRLLVQGRRRAGGGVGEHTGAATHLLEVEDKGKICP